MLECMRTMGKDNSYYGSNTVVTEQSGNSESVLDEISSEGEIVDYIKKQIKAASNNEKY